MKLRRHVPALLATTFLVSCSALTVQALASEPPAPPIQDELRYTFDIPAKPLPEALRDFAAVTGMSIAVNRSDAMMLVGIVGRPVQGHLTAGEALAALTARTGVQYRRDNFQKFTLVAPLSGMAREAVARPLDRSKDNAVPPLPEAVREASAQGTAPTADPAAPPAAPRAQEGNRTQLPKINVRSNRPRRTARVAPAPAAPRPTAPVVPNPGGDVGYHAESTSAGTKTNTPLRNIPQAITVVTKQQIQDVGAHRIEDVAHYVPGVNWHQGEGNRDQIVIRGVSSTADFFVDGIRDDGQVFRDLYNTERLEFLKGPNAMIFGRGGSGGVLNRVLKTADGVPINEWKTQTGSYNNARVSGDVGGKITDTLYGRINGVFEDSDTYRDFTHLQRGGVNPTLTWLATPLTKVKLSYEYFHDYRTADRGIPSFAQQPFGGALPRTFFGDPALSNTSLTQNIATAVIDHDFANGLSVKSQTRYANYQHYYQNVYAGSAVSNANTYTLSAYNNSNDRQNVINQTDWTYKFYTADVKHTFVFGTEFGNQQSSNNRHTGLFGASTSSGPISVFSPTVFNTPVNFRGVGTDARNQSDLNTSSGYIQDQIELTRWLQIIGGIRFDRFDLSYVNLNEQSALFGQTFSRTDDLWSPRIGGVLKPIEPFSFYGSYSVSYLPSSGDQFGALTAISTGLKPEKFTNQEVGTKWDILPRLTMTTAFYQLDRENTPIKDSTGTGLTVATGQSRVKGIEVGLAGYVTDKWQISAGYANVSAHFLTDTANGGTGAVAARAGSHVPFVPTQTYSLWNRYDINYNWGVGLGVISQTEYYAAADNLVHVPGYTRVDAAVFWRLNKYVKAQINVENIFGATYYPTADSNNNITIGSPRAAWFTLTTNFTGEDRSSPMWGPGIPTMFKPASTGPTGSSGASGVSGALNPGY
jgi:catecholate siderophore receptor